MTEREHTEWDAVEEAVKAAIHRATELYERFPDHPQAAAKNRVAMALDSLETAADQLTAARVRYAQAEQEAQRIADMHEAVHDRMVEREG